jgi:ankyrin repeat protein
VAEISGETSIPNTEAWAAIAFDGLAILAKYALLKQHLELLDPSLAIVPTLHLLVDGFLADGQVFKKFGYNYLFEHGYLSLEHWKEFQHRQLDDDITLLDDTFGAVAKERSQDNLGDAAADEYVSPRCGEPPLVAAAGRGHEYMVWLLLNQGEDVNLGWRKTPLLAAVEKGHESVVRLLLDRGADVNCESVVRLLLDRGADVESDPLSKPPLLAAVEEGHESVVRLLLGRGANVDCKWNLGSPLMTAVEGGNESLVRLLAYRGASRHDRVSLLEIAPMTVIATNTTTGEGSQGSPQKRME